MNLTELYPEFTTAAAASEIVKNEVYSKYTQEQIKSILIYINEQILITAERGENTVYIQLKFLKSDELRVRIGDLIADFLDDLGYTIDEFEWHDSNSDVSTLKILFRWENI